MMIDLLFYIAHGAVAGMQLGHAATGQAGWGQAFDPARLWPVRIVAGTTAVTANTSTASGAVLFGLDYDNYEANGNIAAVTRTLRTGAYGTPYTMDFGYSYDRLNRLTGCAVAGAEYNYVMDEFGNITARTQAAGGGGQMPNSMAMAVSPLTNQLSGAGYAYDVLGNLVTMPAADGVGTVSMTYLDQGHIGTLTDAAGVVWKYYYDADGKRRIKVKTAGGAATEPDGQGGVRLVADRSFYFYEGEDLICQQDIGDLVQDDSQYEPKFLLLDHLGSTRAELVFDPSTLAPQIEEYYDLMPYGEVIGPSTTQESVLFTGKSRDIESGYNFFGNRFYSSNIFRFLSADKFAGAILGPQSLNRYSYCHNSPTSYIDHDGNLPIWAGVVLVGAAGGAAKGFHNGVMAYREDNKSVFGVSWSHVAYESMKGFIGGFAGTLAGAFVGYGTKNPYLIGASAGALDSLSEQYIDRVVNNEIPCVEDALLETVSSAIFCRLFSPLLRPRPVGRPASMWKGRTLKDYLNMPNLRYQTIMGGMVETATTLNRENINRYMEYNTSFEKREFDLHMLTDFYGERWKKESGSPKQEVTGGIIDYQIIPESK